MQTAFLAGEDKGSARYLLAAEISPRSAAFPDVYGCRQRQRSLLERAVMQSRNAGRSSTNWRPCATSMAATWNRSCSTWTTGFIIRACCGAATADNVVKHARRPAAREPVVGAGDPGAGGLLRGLPVRTAKVIRPAGPRERRNLRSAASSWRRRRRHRSRRPMRRWPRIRRLRPGRANGKPGTGSRDRTSHGTRRRPSCPCWPGVPPGRWNLRHSWAGWDRRGRAQAPVRSRTTPLGR